MDMRILPQAVASIVVALAISLSLAALPAFAGTDQTSGQGSFPSPQQSAAVLSLQANEGAEGFAGYTHDPMKNPRAAADVVANANAVFGFAPNPDSARLGSYAAYDWTDPAIATLARSNREAYHASMQELYGMIDAMQASGNTTEEIARAVSNRRNELRMEAYKDDPEGLEQLKQNNLAVYGDEMGGSPEYFYEKYGSWAAVIEGALSTNAGMDACCGLYDEYYHTYIIAHGQCGAQGSDLIWRITNGVLIVEGTGAMADFGRVEDTPWYPYASEFESVTIAAGVTHIGRHAFDGLAKADRAIDAADVQKTYGDWPFYLAAAANVSIGGDAVALRYTLDDSGVLESLGGSKVRIRKAGTATVTITAPETANCKQSVKTVTVTVAKAPRAINAANVQKTYGDWPFYLAASTGASASPAGFLRYSLDRSGVLESLGGSKVRIKKAGNATVTITAPETACYKQAVKTVTVTVRTASRTRPAQMRA